MQSKNSSSNSFPLRPYQKEAKNVVIRNILDMVRNAANNATNTTNMHTVNNAQLLEMATGSGKTVVTGNILSHILRASDKLSHILGVQGLNVVVLSNRIDGVNQFYTDIIQGREDKDAILHKTLTHRTSSYMFHSYAQDLEYYQHVNAQNKHQLHFSTYQTADLKNLADKLSSVDLIIVDEAHNITRNAMLRDVLASLTSKGRNNFAPPVLALTATPDNYTKKLFGDSIYAFGLAEYLASGHSPSVHYELIASSGVHVNQVEDLSRQIESATNMTDLEKKKQMIQDIGEALENILNETPETRILCTHILQKIAYPKTRVPVVDTSKVLEISLRNIQNTVIFVNSVKQANEIAKQINSITYTNHSHPIAQSYHSHHQGNNVLDNLQNPHHSTKILIVASKLSESIDLPTVKNVVFLRTTNSTKIFLQQFGRGLRGNDTVRYFDYVGSLHNFRWIDSIHKKYREYQKTQTSPSSPLNPSVSQNPDSIDWTQNISQQKEKFVLDGSGLKTSDFAMDIYELVQRFEKLKTWEPLSMQAIQNYFKHEKTLEEWKNLNTKERLQIKIFGYGLIAIARMLWIQWDPVGNTGIWYSVLEKIFTTTMEYSKKEALTPQKIQEYFLQEKTLEEWKNLSTKERLQIKICGHGIITIVRKMWVAWMSFNNTVWCDLLEKIFNVPIDRPNRLIIDRIQNHFKREKTLEEWKNMSQNERKQLKICGYGIKAIASKMKIKGKNPVKNTNAWNDLLDTIFTQK